MATAPKITVLRNGVTAGDFTSAVIHCVRGGDNLNVGVVTTAHGGTTPTMDVKVQWSFDKVNWITVAADAFTQITTSEVAVQKAFTLKAPYARVFFDQGGTNPTYTIVSHAWVN